MNKMRAEKIIISDQVSTERQNEIDETVSNSR